MRAGFTLIELSVVLVIIGLIVGSILTGQHLINAAANRSVISDIEKFKTAVMTFRGKYDCLPGDCTNATAFFGAASTCGDGVPIASGTCNGNGNGQIDPGAPVAYNSEDVVFWQQLALAQMIPGSYNGFTGGSSGYFSYAVGNIPFSNAFLGVCYGIAWGNTTAESPAAMFSIVAANLFFFGSNINPQPGNGGSAGCQYMAITPSAAYNIDSKIDDGNPAKGTVTTYAFSYNPTGATGNPCIANEWTSTQGYALSSNNPYCMLMFQAGF